MTESGNRKWKQLILKRFSIFFTRQEMHSTCCDTHDIFWRYTTQLSSGSHDTFPWVPRASRSLFYQAVSLIQVEARLCPTCSISSSYVCSSRKPFSCTTWVESFLTFQTAIGIIYGCSIVFDLWFICQMCVGWASSYCIANCSLDHMCFIRM